MRKAEVNIILPSFEELGGAAAKPQAVNTAERSCAVIAPISRRARAPYWTSHSKLCHLEKRGQKR